MTTSIPRRQFDDNGNCTNPEPPETRREQLLRLIRAEQAEIADIANSSPDRWEKWGDWLRSCSERHHQRLADLQQQLQQEVSRNA